MCSLCSGYCFVFVFSNCVCVFCVFDVCVLCLLCSLFVLVLNVVINVYMCTGVRYCVLFLVCFVCVCLCVCFNVFL